ncbi:MAG: aliphatic sulfonate ABC transporter substrate-binding protein [Polyangiales bacterium]
MKWWLLCLCLACGSREQPLRIGYQKTGALFLLKARNTLQDVTWVEFQAGAPLMEALRADAIDVGYVGETPPVFAQAGDVPFVYLAADPPAPHAEAIVVQDGIARVADLQGKKIAVQRGSNAHYLLLRALQRASVTPAEVVYLAPGDARSAFEARHVDAWAIWDPFLAVSELRGARVLQDGEELVQNQFFYVARRGLAQERLKPLMEQLRALGDWASTHHEQAAQLLADASGLPYHALLASERRHPYGLRAITPALLDDQQRIADAFLAAQLIPRAIRVHEAVLQAAR